MPPYFLASLRSTPPNYQDMPIEAISSIGRQTNQDKKEKDTHPLQRKKEP
jgi:hypothetical protein